MPSTFDFTAKIWLYSGDKAAWHFVSLPEDLSAELNDIFADQKRGWCSLPVQVTIGSARSAVTKNIPTPATWPTSIFWDSKSNTFILPIKAEVRKKAKLVAGDEVDVEIEVRG